MHCGNKTFMRLGILTQCHFPSLTWKECTSHNRLHHPAIKPCQGAAFLALPGQLWRERSPQTRTPSTEGPPLLPRPACNTLLLSVTLDPWHCDRLVRRVSLALLLSHTPRGPRRSLSAGLGPPPEGSALLLLLLWKGSCGRGVRGEGYCLVLEKGLFLFFPLS